jgi:hypothetical protein
LRPTLVNFFREVIPLLANPLTSAQMKDLLNRPTMDRRDACLRYSMRVLEAHAAAPVPRVVPVVLRRLMRLPRRMPAEAVRAVPAMAAAADASGSDGPALPDAGVPVYVNKDVNLHQDDPYHFYSTSPIMLMLYRTPKTCSK